VIILQSPTPLHWGQLNVPLWGLQRDWFDKETETPLMFSLATDSNDLWFIAAGKTPAQIHPLARPGAFVAELWRYDCAELFLSHPKIERYIEFNLAANGAWWSAEFTQPRQRVEEMDVIFPDVKTFAELSPDGGWMSAMSIPLDVLHARIGWEETSLMNVTFITGSPNQKFLSASKLPGDQPDFHQPTHFSSFRYHPIEE
jgi:hypothetical protein